MNELDNTERAIELNPPIIEQQATIANIPQVNQPQPISPRTIVTEDQLNREQQYCLDLMNSGKNVFIDCERGDDAIIRAFQKTCTQNLVCLAPYPLKACEVEGATVMEFFNFGYEKYDPGELPEVRANEDFDLYRAIDVLVIREVSQLTPDVFVAIFNLLRKVASSKKVQVIVSGNFNVIPPPVTSDDFDYFKENYGGIYAFNTKEWEHLDFETVLLNSAEYVNHLECLAELQTAPMGSPERCSLQKEYEESVRLQYNFNPHSTDCTCIYCSYGFVYHDHYFPKYKHPLEICIEGTIEGYYPEDAPLPTDMYLCMRVGETVMIIANDWDYSKNKYDFVKGDIGTVVSYTPEFNRAIVRLISGRVIIVRQATWNIYKYKTEITDDNRVSIIKTATGKFKQLPLVPIDSNVIKRFSK